MSKKRKENEEKKKNLKMNSYTLANKFFRYNTNLICEKQKQKTFTVKFILFNTCIKYHRNN